MLEIKNIGTQLAENKIKEKVEEAINYSQGLKSLGYEIYNRDIKDEMYKIENSNNYFLGPDAGIYIIYAYGNSNYTSEVDMVYMK